MLRLTLVGLLGIGLLSCTTPLPGNDYHEIQIVTEDPAAVSVRLNGEPIPAVYATNFSDDKSLVLEARVDPKARGVWRGWQSVAGKSGDLGWDYGTTLEFKVDAHHRQVRAKMLWDTSAKALWMGDDRFVFRSRKNGEAAVLAWTADRPGEVRMLDDRLWDAVSGEHRADLGLLLLDNRLLLNGETTYELTSTVELGEFPTAQFLAQGTVLQSSWQGPFALFDATATLLYEASPTSTVRRWTDSVVWLEASAQGYGLRAWFEGKRAVSTLVERTTSVAPLYLLDPIGARVAVRWTTEDGLAQVQIVSRDGVVEQERIGDYLFSEAWFGSDGKTFHVRRPGANESWNLADGAVTVDHAPILNNRISASQAATPTYAAANPRGNRTLVYTPDPIWPVTDLSVVSDGGVSVEVSKLTWVEGVTP